MDLYLFDPERQALGASAGLKEFGKIQFMYQEAFTDQHSLKLLTPVMEYNIFLNHDGIAPETQGIRITDREGFGDELLDHLSGGLIKGQWIIQGPVGIQGTKAGVQVIEAFIHLF